MERGNPPTPKCQLAIYFVKLSSIYIGIAENSCANVPLDRTQKVENFNNKKNTFNVAQWPPCAHAASFWLNFDRR